MKLYKVRVIKLQDKHTKKYKINLTQRKIVCLTIEFIPVTSCNGKDFLKYTLPGTGKCSFQKMAGANLAEATGFHL